MLSTSKSLTACYNVPTAWYRKFSTCNTVLMSIAALLTPSAVGFLAYLWSHPNGGSVNGIFRQIVVGGWTVQVVTITGVVIRFTVSVSAGITTSMLASLILEGRGTRIQSSAAISILRFVNSGPQSLLLTLQQSWRYNWMSMLLITLLFCTTFSLQFTSTLLASDLQNGSLIGPSRVNVTNAGISDRNLLLAGAATSLSGLPRQFPSFAEHHETFPIDSGNGSSVRSTGTLLRAQLPYASSQMRTSINKLSGETTVLDTTVTCARPQMIPEITFIYNYYLETWSVNGTWKPETKIRGLLDADRVFLDGPDLIALDPESNNITIGRYSAVRNAQNESFIGKGGGLKNLVYVRMPASTFQTPFPNNSESWTLSLQIFQTGPALLSTLDPRYPFDKEDDVLQPSKSAQELTEFSFGKEDKRTNFKQGDPVQLLSGLSYLVLNLTNGSDRNIPALANSTYSDQSPETRSSYVFASYEEGFTRLVATPRDEWLVFTIPELPGWEASVSLCYDSFVGMNLLTELESIRGFSEPSLSTFNDSTERFETRAVRTQLDYGNAPNERGVMSLTSSSNEIASQMSSLYRRTFEANETHIPNQSFIKASLRSLLDINKIFIVCNECTALNTSATLKALEDDGGTVYISGALQQMFMDMAQPSRNIPLALSSYLTTLAQTMYYDVLPYFNTPAELTVSQYDAGLFPRRFTGLIVVLVLLTIHTSIVIVTAIAFLRLTSMSRIGDAAWQAIGQMHCEEMQRVLEKTTMVPDHVVDEHIADIGLKDRVMILRTETVPQLRALLLPREKLS